MTHGLDGLHLPAGWRWSQLRHLTSVLHRGTAPDYVEEGPVRVVGQVANRAGGIDWDRTRFHAYSGNPRRLKGFLEPGDVLVNSTGTGTLGRIALFEGAIDGRSCVADSHITIVRGRPEELLSRFMFYFLTSQSFQGFMMATLVSGATNQIELSPDRMGSAPVPLPSLADQRRITAFLDEEVRRIDRQYYLRDKQVRLLHEHFTTFVSGIVRRRAARLGDSDALPLRRVLASVKTGGTPPSMEEWHFSEDGIPWYGPSSFDWAGLRNPVKQIAPQSVHARVVPRFAPGSVLVVGIGATAGKVAYLDHFATANQQITALLPSKRLSGRHLYWQLWSARHELRKLAPYTTLPIINNEFLKSFPIIAPSSSVQAEDCKVIDSALSSLLQADEAIRRTNKLLMERRQALISAVVTGQIDVTTARRMSA